MSEEGAFDALELDEPPLDPRRAEVIRQRAQRVLAEEPPPVGVRIEAAASSVFSVLMLLWALSSVIVSA